MMELELDNQEEYGERLSQVFEAGRRLCSDGRHHRRGAGSDSGHAASRGHHRSGQGHRRRFRCHHLRRWAWPTFFFFPGQGS